MSLKIAAYVIGILAAIWGLFIQYLILTIINTTDLIWFLFWTYVPMVIVFTLLRESLRD